MIYLVFAGLLLAGESFAQDSLNVSQVWLYEALSNACDVDVAGNYAYATEEYSGLRIFDITNPASPAVAGFYDDPGTPTAVAVAGNYAYVLDFAYGISRLRVIDISNPAAPVVAGSYNTQGDAWSVAILGDNVYVANGGNGLRVINITNPAAPTEVGFCETPGYALGVAVLGNYVYIADADSGLRVIDITNPTVPVETGFYDTPGMAQSVAVAGNFAYVADGDYFGIYDCSQATSAQDRSQVQPLSYALHPCYPNPFNPSTTIAFDLPSMSPVALIVYNINGQAVETLVNGVMPFGSHTVEFNATDLSSGVYFYSLTANNFSASRKMLLIK